MENIFKGIQQIGDEMQENIEDNVGDLMGFDKENTELVSTPEPLEPMSDELDDLLEDPSEEGILNNLEEEYSNEGMDGLDGVEGVDELDSVDELEGEVDEELDVDNLDDSIDELEKALQEESNADDSTQVGGSFYNGLDGDINKNDVPNFKIVDCVSLVFNVCAIIATGLLYFNYSYYFVLGLVFIVHSVAISMYIVWFTDDENTNKPDLILRAIFGCTFPPLISIASIVFKNYRVF